MSAPRARECALRAHFFFFDAAFDDFFFGTLAPDFRASDKPIAIACLRLFTFLPERPLLSFPLFFSCIARSTFSDAFLPYFGMTTLLLLPPEGAAFVPARRPLPISTTIPGIASTSRRVVRKLTMQARRAYFPWTTALDM